MVIPSLQRTYQSWKDSKPPYKLPIHPTTRFPTKNIIIAIPIIVRQLAPCGLLSPQFGQRIAFLEIGFPHDLQFNKRFLIFKPS